MVFTCFNSTYPPFENRRNYHFGTLLHIFLHRHIPQISKSSGKTNPQSCIKRQCLLGSQKVSGLIRGFITPYPPNWGIHPPSLFPNAFLLQLSSPQWLKQLSHSTGAVGWGACRRRGNRETNYDLEELRSMRAFLLQVIHDWVKNSRISEWALDRGITGSWSQSTGLLVNVFLFRDWWVSSMNDIYAQLISSQTPWWPKQVKVLCFVAENVALHDLWTGVRSMI